MSEIFLIDSLHIFAGRVHGRQMDDYVDDLFENVLDQGPPVSDDSSNWIILIVKLNQSNILCNMCMCVGHGQSRHVTP